jgi:hypothetical protein
MTTPVPLLVDTNAAAVAVGRPFSTIRRWAHEERFAAHGRDPKGRKLYALADVQAVAREFANHARRVSVVKVEPPAPRPEPWDVPMF